MCDLTHMCDLVHMFDLVCLTLYTCVTWCGDTPHHGHLVLVVGPVHVTYTPQYV